MLLDNRNDLADWKHDLLKEVRFQLDRRQFLKAAAMGSAALAGGLSLLSLGSSASAQTPSAGQPSTAPKIAGNETAPKAVKTGTFYFPRMMFHVKDETGDQWDTDPVGDAILRRRLGELTNVNISQDPVVVKLSDLDHCCRYPFIFATSEGYFDLPPQEEKNLKEFLLRGGFVHADDCVLGKDGDRFFKDYVKMIDKLFPDNPMTRVPNDHELFHCYFDFDKGSPHMQGKDHGAFGLFEKGTGRIMTLCTPGDLHCGWMCQFFSKEQNEAALRMGINIIIYYLTH